MSIPKPLREDPGLSDWCILSCYRGSIAHGTYRPSSDPHSIDDKDVLAICVPSVDYYLGLKQYGSRGTRERKWNEWDVVIYEARKMVSLLSKGNPNVLSALWCDSKHYIKRTGAGNLLIDSRELFTGSWVYHSFTGYAHSQLSRMERFNHQGYMGEKRKALVEKFGYDTKNASHLIRLLKMGIEFLNDGQLYVEREDASMLLDIKNGLWDLDRVKREAYRLFQLSDLAYLNSSLPVVIDRDAVNDLCVKIVRKALDEREGKL